MSKLSTLSALRVLLRKDASQGSAPKPLGSPRPLSLADLHKVGGGLPRKTW